MSEKFTKVKELAGKLVEEINKIIEAVEPKETVVTDRVAVEFRKDGSFMISTEIEFMPSSTFLKSKEKET